MELVRNQVKNCKKIVVIFFIVVTLCLVVETSAAVKEKKGRSHNTVNLTKVNCCSDTDRNAYDEWISFTYYC